MPYDPQRHHRRSVRLRGYDYAQAGAYFVTTCVQGRECLFGTVVGAAMDLNAVGRTVAAWWDALPGRYPTVDLDASVVMPNHFHGIILLSEAPGQTAGPCTVQGGETPPLRPESGGTPPLRMVGRCTVQGGGTPPLRGPSPPVVGAGFPRPERCNDKNKSSQSVEAAPTGAIVPRPTLGQIVAYFKYQTTKAINQALGSPGRRLWQRSFHDHVIRNEESLDRLREYVVNNPLSWQLDQLHPDRPSKW